MKKLYLLILLVLSGCAPWSTNHNPEYDLAQAVAIDAWVDCYGELSDTAQAALESYDLVEMDFDELNPCVSSKAVGCYFITNTIFLDTARSAAQRGCTLQHELYHLLSWYEFNDVQTTHKNENVWDKFGHDTIEYRACKEYKESR